MEETQYVLAPEGWTPERPNPFTPDGAYGLEWSCVQILRGDDKRLHYEGHARSSSGIYSLKIGSEGDKLESNLADFIRYESSNGRTVIVSCPPEMDGEGLLERALKKTPALSVVRKNDPKWVVHSTPLNRWEQIQACGELRSVARLEREGLKYPALGFDELGEPEDYREHIVLGDYMALSAEHVVVSHAKGYVYTDADAPYEPGVRLYFDAHRIIEDGLGVRDGMHLLKVKDHLRLDPYLVSAIGVKDVDPEGIITEWTPRLFWQKATEYFEERRSEL